MPFKMPNRRRAPARRTKKYTPRKVRSQTPARLDISRRVYYKNRSINKSINRIAENKLIPMTAQDQTVPQPILAGNNACYVGYCSGPKPVGWDANIKALDGITANSSVRNGSYIYLAKSTVSISIDTKQTTAATQQPTQFRVVVCKARRANGPVGTNPPQPDGNLFLDSSGKATSYKVTGFNGMDIMLQPLNKRDWVILKDTKFTLSNWVAAGTGGAGTSGYTGFYGNMKEIRLSLPYYKKTHYRDSDNLPSDLDYNYAIMIFARSLDQTSVADNWEASVRGTTSYKDF